MKDLKLVNKTLGENVKCCQSIHADNKLRKTNMFMTQRANFCKNLRDRGYKTKSHGNYITATKDSESLTFYFVSHSNNTKNYLVPYVLRYEVNYFAFYDNEKECVYMISYGLVRKYCKLLKNSFTFYNNMPKLFIPDTWAKEQNINTYVM